MRIILLLSSDVTTLCDLCNETMSFGGKNVSPELSIVNFEFLIFFALVIFDISKSLYFLQENSDYEGAKNCFNSQRRVKKKRRDQSNTHGREETGNHRSLKKDAKIFYKAPIVTFFYHFIFYIVFLLLLSFMALFGMGTANLRIIRLIVFIWVLGILAEDIIEV